jgi:hypothetical protein
MQHLRSAAATGIRNLFNNTPQLLKQVIMKAIPNTILFLTLNSKRANTGIACKDPETLTLQLSTERQ